MRTRLGRVIAGYPELALVLVAAAVGLGVPRPLAWLDTHQGINVLLAVLVFATALSIEPAALRRLPATWRPLSGVLVAGVTILPFLAWAASRLVAAGSLRNGVLSVGLAPCEIASVATTAMAGGEAALAAGVLVGSTVATVALAGPILSLEVGHAGVRPGHIAANLALVVVLPLLLGFLVRSSLPVGPRAERVAGHTATLSVAALMALIAAQVHLSVRYLAVAGALVLFLAGAAGLATLIGARSTRPVATAVLLTTSMRDFTIAAGLATAASGPAAAAPLGLYGIAVLTWGTAAAGMLRRRGAKVSTPVVG